MIYRDPSENWVWTKQINLNFKMMMKGTFKENNKLNRSFHSNQLSSQSLLNTTKVVWATWTSSQCKYLKIRIVLTKSNSRNNYKSLNKILHQLKIWIWKSRIWLYNNKFYRYRMKLKLNKDKIKTVKHSCSFSNRRRARSRNKLISYKNKGALLTELSNSINKKSYGNKITAAINILTLNKNMKTPFWKYFLLKRTILKRKSANLSNTISNL
jgi:hypothetical protein